MFVCCWLCRSPAGRKKEASLHVQPVFPLLLIYYTIRVSSDVSRSTTAPFAATSTSIYNCPPASIIVGVLLLVMLFAYWLFQAVAFKTLIVRLRLGRVLIFRIFLFCITCLYLCVLVVNYSLCSQIGCIYYRHDLACLFTHFSLYCWVTWLY